MDLTHDVITLRERSKNPKSSALKFEYTGHVRCPGQPSIFPGKGRCACLQSTGGGFSDRIVAQLPQLIGLIAIRVANFIFAVMEGSNLALGLHSGSNNAKLAVMPWWDGSARFWPASGGTDLQDIYVDEGYLDG